LWVEVLTVIEKETPRPGEGTLLVEVQAAGVNYADLMARFGLYPAITKAPFALGFEVAGVVREVGKGVDGFKPGDSVAAITPPMLCSRSAKPRVNSFCFLKDALLSGSVRS
jgi:NADPH:quinone reductase-like Zn-dependent oxidoreductase